MQYLAQITKAINDRIRTEVLTDARFQGSQYNGIAILAADGESLRPLITDHYDEDRFISPDDQIPLTIYHRTISITRTDDDKRSVGDNQFKKKETAAMALIAIGSRKLIKLTPEELEAALVSGFPSVIGAETRKTLNLNACTIKPTTSILDPVAVYAQEYQTKAFELRPNALLIRINYNIESAYNTACFDLCNC